MASALCCLCWRFEKGTQTMNGKRALVYSRIRENQLDAGDSDASRAGMQQQVVQAIMDKASGPGTLFAMPWMGDDLMKPVATDLSPWQVLQLGWVKFRAGTTVHCRLGGVPSGGYILWLELPKSCDSVALFETLVDRGITIGPGPMFSASQRYRNCMRISVGHPWSERQERALREVGRLAQQMAGETAKV